MAVPLPPKRVPRIENSAVLVLMVMMVMPAMMMVVVVVITAMMVMVVMVVLPLRDLYFVALGRCGLLLVRGLQNS